jgi:formylglycine-generating enzyme required for sulfatase activity
MHYGRRFSGEVEWEVGARSEQQTNKFKTVHTQTLRIFAQRKARACTSCTGPSVHLDLGPML